MVLALLLALQAQVIVDIHDLSPQEHRSAGFVLSSAQVVRVSAVGAEPWPEKYEIPGHEDYEWQDDQQTTWPAAAWILDVKTRAIVWDLRAAETQRSTDGIRRFAGTVRLPAGVYEAHFAFYPMSSFTVNNQSFGLRDLARLGRQIPTHGHYLNDALYKEFGIKLEGSGRDADDGEMASARAEFEKAAIATVTGKHTGSARQSFALTRAIDVEVYAIGEVRKDGAFDYGWIMNADTRVPVWTMAYDNSEPGGGASKNRMVHEKVRLKAGRYVVYFAADDSHGSDDWNAMPPADPEFWGITLRVTDPAARAAVRPYEYEPVPAGQTIVSLTRVGDDAQKSAGFTLRRPMEVQLYALGEASDNEMVDYAWIVDAGTHKRVWTMRYRDTEPAGGADKNRLFDGKVRLNAGSYLVYYKTDGSHSYDNWNSSPPAEPKYWGVSVSPASGRLNPADVGPFERPSGGTVLAQLVHMGNEEAARTTFKLTRRTTLRVYVLGEGSNDEMFDYGWIADSASGRVIWEMQYDTSEPAGGADKNRVFDGMLTLPAGVYMLRYQSDGSHAYSNWNDDPPDDPESWGITVFRIVNR